MTARRPHPRLAAAVCGALLLAGCGDRSPQPAPLKPPAQPAPLADGERLLTIDGIDITYGEVAVFVKFLDSYAPEYATKVKVRKVLDAYTIPLHLARRAFPEQRAQMLERAKNLCAVATNAIELEKQGAQQVIKHKNTTRSTVELPIAMFLFDDLITGSVSPPIEVPRGWVVASAYDLRKAAAVIDDLADAVQVGFLTHTPGDWSTWLDLEKARIKNKVTYVHPDYREALPEWIQLP